MQMMQVFNAMRNPTQAITNMAQQNPAMKQALQMSKGKSPQEVEQVCKNLCNQLGIDYSQALQQFNQMGSQFGINL